MSASPSMMRVMHIDGPPELTSATSLSVCGLLSSPGNRMTGDGAADVSWKATQSTTSRLRTLRPLDAVLEDMLETEPDII
ncbi:hypothetical protein EYF80_054300 [Liparis tanakae]|uniref:Uncharacterized protein n=1 Tax=Liparis tanakae TaxID=230148 RepID=A0A4Z2F3R8_9TELE|nr:hypothetical protein EYF80_054300 [Liparis tanakae]